LLVILFGISGNVRDLFVFSSAFLLLVCTCTQMDLSYIKFIGRNIWDY